MSIYGGKKVLTLKFPGKKQSYPLKKATMLQKQTPKYARNGCRGALKGNEVRSIPFFRSP